AKLAAAAGPIGAVPPGGAPSTGAPDAYLASLREALAIAIQARATGTGDIRSRRPALAGVESHDEDYVFLSLFVSAVEDLQTGASPSLLSTCRRLAETYRRTPARSVRRAKYAPMMEMLLPMATAATGETFPGVDGRAAPALPGFVDRFRGV